MAASWGNRIRRIGACAGVVALLAAAPAVAAPQPPCVGDCDASGVVEINELIAAVNIVVGAFPETACSYGLCAGRPLGIACLIRMVRNALEGCPAAPATIVFNGEANRLSAYAGEPDFTKQVVIPSDNDAPGVGRDINGQICFTRGPEGEIRFIAGEDTNQGSTHATAGWGFFQLTGSGLGNFAFEQIGKLQPTYQPPEDDAENYGCGFLSDGRLLTTDVGSQADGPPSGQLIIWFPPFNNGFPGEEPVAYCKLDIAIGTAQQIAIDDQDRVYVSSARPGAGAGIYRYIGPFPTSDTPDGGCDSTDASGAPLATNVNKELVIPVDSHLITPSGVVLKPGGGFYVGSVLNGVIVEYDANAQFVRRVLDPPVLGFPIPSGHPLGMGLSSDGSIYFADIGLVVSRGGNIGPGPNTGTVRRVRFVDGQPQPPETMDSGLNFPDGIGILELSPAEVEALRQ